MAAPTPQSTLTANSATTVVVGMSGGVDSSVTAAILREQGYRVIGLFMKNWDQSQDQSGHCSAVEDFEDVVRVCNRLDIPYYSVNFAKEYWDHVFENFLSEYRAGRTPNPDVLCNREIKFKRMFEKARELGADQLATGHYCRVRKSGDSAAKLLKGIDSAKDQSYFLYAIQGAVLNQVLFPIGDLEKSEVRAIAQKYQLATAKKKDSTGICFIGERDFPEFLGQYIRPRRGEFRTLSGEVVGHHTGAAYYTVGQRKGLGLGGQGDPWFVLGKSIENNEVYVERGENHPSLFSSELEASELTWIAGHAPTPETNLRLRAKIRYRQGDQDCVISTINATNLSTAKRIRVTFDQPQRAISVGQSVVFYDGEVCLGGGIIDKRGNQKDPRFTN